MIRKIAIYTLLLVSFFACKHKQPSNLKVHVDLKNNPSEQTVFLLYKEYGLPQVALDTVVIKPGDSKFDFAANANHEGIFRIKFQQDGNYIWFTNDRPEINVNADWNDFGSYIVSTPGSASFKNLVKTFNEKLVGIDSIKQRAYGLQGQDSLLKAVTKAYTDKVSEAVNYVLHYADTTNSAGVAMYAIGILQEKQPDTSELKPVITRLSKRFSSNPELTKICSEYFDYVNKMAAMNWVGSQVPAFSMPDTSGKDFEFKSLQGKYVLVDFWASWCAPCRKENPNVVKAYNAYREKNFTVLGVSLDKEKSDWMKAIHDDHLTWNHVSDLKEWHSMAIPIFRLEGIPYNILVDPHGKVIAQNLRGKVLQDKLAELLK